MKEMWTIIKKELKRFFTDYRILVSLFLPGILIFVIYSLMGTYMEDIVSPKITEFSVNIVNEPTEFNSLLKVEGWEVKINEKNLEKEDALNAIKNKELDLYIVYDANFYTNMDKYETGSGIPPKVEIYYNSSSESSAYIYSYYTSALDTIESAISNKFDINPNVNEHYNLAEDKDTTVQVLSYMMPLLLTTFLFTGSLGICSESIAGEKERGTIATLLITPTKRSHIVLGKIISLGITSLASSIVSFIGLVLSLPKLTGTSFDFSSYGFTTFLSMFGIIVVTVLLFTTLLTIISTMSKSVKEATSYSTPLMIVVLLIGMTNFMSSGATTNHLLYLVPLYNITQAFVGIFSLSLSTLDLLLCIGSNIIYIALGVFALTKMFNNERIIFNK